MSDTTRLIQEMELAASPKAAKHGKAKTSSSKKLSPEYIASAGAAVGKRLADKIKDKDGLAFFDKATKIEGISDKDAFWKALHQSFFKALKEKRKELSDKAPAAAYKEAVRLRIEAASKSVSKDDGKDKPEEKPEPKESEKDSKPAPQPKSLHNHQRAAPWTSSSLQKPQPSPPATVPEAKAAINAATHNIKDKHDAAAGANAGQAASVGLSHDIDGLKDAPNDAARDPKGTALDYAHGMAINAYGGKAADKIINPAFKIAPHAQVIVDDKLPHGTDLVVSPPDGDTGHHVVKVRPSAIESQLDAHKKMNQPVKDDDDDDEPEYADDEEEEGDDAFEVMNGTSAMSGEVATGLMHRAKGLGRAVKELDDAGKLDLPKAMGAVFLCTFAPLGVAFGIGYVGYKAYRAVKDLRDRANEHAEDIRADEEIEAEQKQLETSARHMARQLVYASHYGKGADVTNKLSQYAHDFGDDREFWMALANGVAQHSRRRLKIDEKAKPKVIEAAIKRHLLMKP